MTVHQILDGRKQESAGKRARVGQRTLTLSPSLASRGSSWRF